MPLFRLVDRRSEGCYKVGLAKRYLVCWGNCKATEREAKVFVACLVQGRRDAKVGSWMVRENMFAADMFAVVAPSSSTYTVSDLSCLPKLDLRTVKPFLRQRISTRGSWTEAISRHREVKKIKISSSL